VKISEVVGFEVRNDDATHFRQLLRLNVSFQHNIDFYIKGTFSMKLIVHIPQKISFLFILLTSKCQNVQGTIFCY